MYKLNELIKSDRNIYHTNDLAILWNIANKNTLYTTIKWYVQKGILIPIFKGLYSTVPISDLNPLELARAIIHRYTYLTTESVLAQAGITSQVTYAYTFASSLSKKATVGSFSFLFRKLKDEYLYHPAGILNKDGNFVATTERAVADMMYFNPKYHFDFSRSIDFERVRHLQKEIGYLDRFSVDLDFDVMKNAVETSLRREFHEVFDHLGLTDSAPRDTSPSGRGATKIRALLCVLKGTGCNAEAAEASGL